ncbi:MAG TPA: TrmJ/YjtD family RNA methyltransferase [Candidatus Acidoferrales bacterium]|nr:TrmJ/YjtD family RNA methyltransferase [Candidatus Acidoferrales bacterium]
MLTPAESDRLRLVLVETRNPLNIGAAARAMSNFGFRHLRVVKPYAPAFREARSAVGASSVLARAEKYGTVADAIADCTLVVGTSAIRTRHVHHTVRRSEDAARLIHRRLRLSNVALLFGSEKRGLTNDDLSHCHWLLRIPTHEENISMNLGQAVAVCLYELIRNAKAPRAGEKSPLASAGETERITAMLLDALQLSGFLDLRRVADSEQRIRRLVRRLHLPARDAVIWLGMFRQIVWKLRSERSS